MVSSRSCFTRTLPFTSAACLAALLLLTMASASGSSAAPVVDDPFFPDYADVLSQLQDLESGYPGIVDYQIIGHASQDGRDIVAVKISDNVADDEDEPAWVFSGFVHGKEQLGMRVVLDLAEELASGYGAIPTITDWVDAYEIWVIPSLNPWGYDHDESGGARLTGTRKNGPNTGDVNSSGVDLGRNYDFEWGGCGSANADDHDFYGPSAFSENETQLIRDFFVLQRPLFGLTFHQGNDPDGGQIMRPWSGSGSNVPPDADRLRDLAELYADWVFDSRDDGPFCDFSLTDPDGGGACTNEGDHEYCNELCWEPDQARLGRCGQPSNWYYHEVGTFDYTFEISDRMFNGDFLHDPAGPSPGDEQDVKDIATEFVRNHRDAIKDWFDYFLYGTSPFQFTGPGLTGHVTDALLGTPLAATVEVAGYTSSLIEDRTSDREFGRYWRLLPTDTHNVTVSKSGYETWSGSVTVGTGALTELNVALTPTMEIWLPDDTQMAWVGPPTDTHKFTVRLQLGSAGVACIGPLPFEVYIRDETATWVEASTGVQACVQDSYWVSVEAPDDSDGDFAIGATYDLLVALDTVTDTSPSSVHYAGREEDTILVMDISGSMDTGGKLAAAKEAAALLVHEMTDDDQGALVWFTGDNVEPNHDAGTKFQLSPMNVGNQTLLIGDISGLSTVDMTSIGDGLTEALDESESPRAEPDHYCGLVLLSDGLENEAAYWNNLITRTQESSCTVHTIALGPETDELLMEEISQKGTPGTDDDGSYHFATISDTSLKAPTAPTAGAHWPNRLAGKYDAISSQLAGRQRLYKALGVFLGVPITHPIQVDKSVGAATFALKWNGGGGGDALTLIQPDGKVIGPSTPGVVYRAGSTDEVYRISSPITGEWQARVDGEKGLPYILLASGQTDVEFALYTSADVAPVRQGEAVHILGLLTSRGRAISGADVRVAIHAPDGQSNTLQLYDDGQHDDGMADDGFYANIYDRSIAGDRVEPKQDPDLGEGLAVRGSYDLEATAHTSEFVRIVETSFSVIPSTDSDGDGMPDPWEKAHGLNPEKAADALDDPDADGLVNKDEFQAGTDPHDSDTDDGGESDGSEVTYGRDPLWHADDAISPVTGFSLAPLPAGARVTWTSHTSHDSYVLRGRPVGSDSWPFYWNLPFTDVFSVTQLDNGTTYEFMMLATAGLTQIRGLNAASTISSANSTILSVTPVADPFPPQGDVLINGGAATAAARQVTLTLSATADTTEMRLSSKLDEGTDEVAGAWRSYRSELGWTIPVEVGFGGTWTIYAQFRDGAGNESDVTTDSILYQPALVYLPLVLK